MDTDVGRAVVFRKLRNDHHDHASVRVFLVLYLSLLHHHGHMSLALLSLAGNCVEREGERESGVAISAFGYLLLRVLLK